MSNQEFKNKIRDILNEYEQLLRTNGMNGYANVYKNGAISRIEAAHIKAQGVAYGKVS